MFNTIILKHGYAQLTMEEYKRFRKGDSIFGNNSDPEEIARWSISDEDDARKELANHRNEYRSDGRSICRIDEYALEFCECDEDGEFIEGSDYEMAEEKGE